jgi:hypothetical protein
VAAGAALQIYEALEMWDQLIVCYRLLDKRAAAQEVISKRLKVGLRAGRWNPCQGIYTMMFVVLMHCLSRK